MLGGIQASAVLHKAQRQTDSEGRIVAAIADYANAWNAFNIGVSSVYGTRVRKEIVALVKVAEDMGAKLYDEPEPRIGSDNPSVEITVSRNAPGARRRIKDDSEPKDRGGPRARAAQAGPRSSKPWPSDTQSFLVTQNQPRTRGVPRSKCFPDAGSR